MKLKFSAVLLFGCVGLLSCDGNDDDKDPVRSDYYVVNNVDNTSNVAVYSYPAKTYTSKFQRIDVPSKANASAKDGDFIYVNTGYYNTGKLRKINLTNAAEVKSVVSHVDGEPMLIAANNNIILYYSTYNPSVGYYSVIKFYDQNLTLLDSLAETEVAYLSQAVIANNKLFFGALTASDGDVIRVMDLGSHSYVKTIKLGRVTTLMGIGEGKVLASLSNDTAIIDAASYETTSIGNAYIESGVFSPLDNNVYYLRAATQPSLVAYYLCKLDLTSKQSMIINSQQKESIMPPMLLDDAGSVIVAAPGVKVFSLTGELLDHVVDAPSTTVGIFRK